MNASEDRSVSGLDRTFTAGLAWTAGAKWATQLITWASVLLLTRLLSPADYGIGEIAGLFTTLANVLAEFGIGNAVLHMPHLSKRALAQLNLFSCLFGVTVFTLANLAIPTVAAFFHTDQFWLFVVDNLTLVITGFQSVPMGLLQRELNYRRISYADCAMVLVQAVCTVILAWRGFGFWALVIGVIAGKIVGAIIVCSWKPVGFSWPRLKEIAEPLRMGWHSAIGRIAWALSTQADTFVVGRFLGESTLGAYRLATTLASAPADKIASLLMRAAGPMFANVKDDQAMVRRYYLLLTEFFTLTIMPLMVGLALVSPLAVRVVFGTAWSASVGPLRWLALFMIVRTLSTLTDQVLNSQLRTAFLAKISVVLLCIMPPALAFAAVRFGASGVAATWVALTPLALLAGVVVLLGEIRLSVADYLNSLLPASVGCVVMSLGLWLFSRFVPLPGLPPAVLLGVSVMVGAALYLSTIWLAFRERPRRYLRFLSGFRGKSAATIVSA